METVTTFNNLLSTHPQTVSLSDVFTQIKTDKNLQMLTEMHRQGAGQKQRVPVFVPSSMKSIDTASSSKTHWQRPRSATSIMATASAASPA